MISKSDFRRSVEDSLFAAGISSDATAGMNGHNILEYTVNAYDLIGQRVSVHTNRNAHIWSVLGPNGKSPVRAYALDCVFLKDVCWLPPTISAGRSTFQKYKVERRQERTVQAFAEGTLVAIDGMAAPEIIYSLEGVPLRYNPMSEEWVGAFRSLDKTAVASSEFASLAYKAPLSEFYVNSSPTKSGGRSTETCAYGDLEYIPEEYDRMYVESIVTHDDSQVDRALKRYRSAGCRRYLRSRSPK